MKWEQAWLTYGQIENSHDADSLKAVCYHCTDKRIVTAVEELTTAFEKMYQRSLAAMMIREDEVYDKPAIYLKKDSGRTIDLGDEGYEIILNEGSLTVTAAADKGVLYGVFGLIRGLKTGKSLTELSVTEVPENPLRMINHWDNSDGSIERGYSGRSFFFEDGKVLLGDRIRDYARMMASIGINGIVINNVNVALDAIEFITDRYFEPLTQIAEVFDQYGIRLFLCLDYAATIDIGGLDTADPLEPEVAQWWRVKMKDVFEKIPNFGGFLIKADSEGRPGPFTYGRTHADGANMLAKAVKPYGGIIIWRCFVYNCQQDWRDYKTDRARAGYDNFMPIDGHFDDNVILQIKNGPMDFQVREPVSPLIGAMKGTNQIIEFQIAQEYTGQQRHVCYLIPMWKEALEFQTWHSEEFGQVKDVVSGRTYGNELCGIAAVTNTGNDANWTGHDLAAANLYGYGRLTWNTSLSAEEIAREWIIMTYGSDQKVIQVILDILMMSWPTYEKYTSPLGIGWMINPSHHYGPNIDGYEYDRWGTYHRSDHKAMGVARTTEGTGYVDQYHKKNRDMYNSIESCPEELLLFFHRIPYTYTLSTGKTLIQHIYDTHFEGVEDVEEMVTKWHSLEGLVEDHIFERTSQRFAHQLEHAVEWRDVVNSYFYRKTLIEDEKGRKIF